MEIAYETPPVSRWGELRPARRSSRGMVLADHELLQDLDEQDLRELERLSRRIVVKRHEVHFPREHSVGLVERGRLKRLHASNDGKEVVLRILKPGDVFGELNVLDEPPPEFILEALEDSRVLYVPGNQLRRLATQNAMFSLRLAELIGKRKKRLEERFASLALKDVRARLAALLVELSGDYGVRDVRGTLFRVSVSQRLMAELIGSSREMVNIILSEFRREGIIDFVARRVIVREPEALEELAA